MKDSRLTDLLGSYNEALAHSPKRDQHLKALASGSAAAVVTGQQVGLYLSPLLVLYKALAAVKTAESIQKETGNATVPVFWLQSEDHDFAEIRCAKILDPSGELIELSLGDEANRQSVHYHLLTEEIEQLNQQLAEHIGFQPHGAEVIDLVNRHYRRGTSIVDAFAALLAEITAEYGLVFFNPRTPGAAELTQAVYQQALDRYQEIALELKRQNTEITNSGQTPQVHVRDGSPLFFFHAESPSGPRHRLQWDSGENAFSVVGGNQQLSLKELQALLSSEPERFSSSALLRPILQDSLFPTTAYIAGPTERQYFKQIAPLYPLFGLQQPQIRPRTQLLLVEPKAKVLLGELNLSAADLICSEEELLAKLAQNSAEQWLTPEALQNRISDSMSPIWQLLSENVSAVDGTLEKPLEKTRTNVENLFGRFLERYTKAAGSQDEVALNRLKRLQGMLQPAGEAQERTIALVYYLAKYGHQIVDSVYRTIEPETSMEETVEIQEVAL